MTELPDRLGPDKWFAETPGSPGVLPASAEIARYFSELAESTSCLKWLTIGEDTFGERIGAAIISAPANLWALDSRGSVPKSEGSAPITVVITAGIHPDEVAGPLAMPELAWRLLSGPQAASSDILQRLTIVLVPMVLPGGYERVRTWYDTTKGTPYEGSVPPGIVHPVGHDLNRDWLGLTQPETRLLAETVFRRWRPALHLDLHAMQPNAARYILPPPIDPIDPLLDPAILAEINACGAEMLAEMTANGCTGVASGVLFDGWSPSRSFIQFVGGGRVLAEVASARLAMPIDLHDGMLARYRDLNPAESSAHLPAPWPGGRWSLRDAVEYHAIAAHAFLTHAASRRDRIAAAMRSAEIRWLQSSERATYVLFPLEAQHDVGATWRLVETLQHAGLEVREAARPFIADDVLCPAGSLIVEEAQDNGRFARAALAPLLYPMPDTRPSATLPYDVTAHTVGLLLGVDVAQLHDPVGVESRPPQPPKPISPDATTIACRDTRAFAAVSALLAAGETVVRVLADRPDEHLRAGDFVVGERAHSLPERNRLRLRKPTVGLYRTWAPDQPDGGWVAQLLSGYGFPPEDVDDQAIRSGSLDRFDVLVIPDMSSEHLLSGNNVADYPAAFCGGLGHQGVAALCRWADRGGTLIAIGAGCDVFANDGRVPVRCVPGGRHGGRSWIPGAILRFEVDRQHPLTFGCDSTLAAMVTDGPSFELRSGATRPTGPVRYPLDDPLLSGWMAGAESLRGRAAVADVPFGRGRMVLMGLRPGFRGVGLAAGRLLANAVLMGARERTR